MTTNLFSSYRQGENRVTATFLAVLQRLSLPNIDRILGALLGEDTFSLVTFQNQPKGKRSTPDARIGTGSTIWIETKTIPNAVGQDQIKAHLESLSDGGNFLLLTPDHEKPGGLPEKVVWSNFNNLASSIEEILKDEGEPPSEKEAFLLREYISMLRQDGLIGSTMPRVMILGASMAWPMYESLGVYRCAVHKPMARLQDSDHMAFYAAGEIKPLVPKIKSVIESIDMSQPGDVESLDSPQKELAAELREKIDLHQQHHEFGQAFKVMFLSHPNDDETVKLQEPIKNDKKDKNGNAVPFTYGQPRYVTLESLKKSTKTSELELG